MRLRKWIWWKMILWKNKSMTFKHSKKIWMSTMLSTWTSKTNCKKWTQMKSITWTKSMHCKSRSTTASWIMLIRSNCYRGRLNGTRLLMKRSNRHRMYVMSAHPSPLFPNKTTPKATLANPSEITCKISNNQEWIQNRSTGMIKHPKSKCDRAQSIYQWLTKIIRKLSYLWLNRIILRIS